LIASLVRVIATTSAVLGVVAPHVLVLTGLGVMAVVYLWVLAQVIRDKPR